MSKSQEEAATTSNTLLLDNLESSFSWVTWLRRCHRLPNQYWKLSWLKCLPPQWQQLWPNTLLTCLRDGNYFGSSQLLALTDHSALKEKKNTGPEQSIHPWAWPLHFKWWGHCWLQLDNETCKKKKKERNLITKSIHHSLRLRHMWLMPKTFSLDNSHFQSLNQTMTIFAKDWG